MNRITTRDQLAKAIAVGAKSATTGSATLKAPTQRSIRIIIGLVL
jgi:hypothetical protein